MAACANCNKKFDKKSGKKGYYRFSLEKSLPNSDLVARDVLTDLTGVGFTPMSVKSQGQFLCPSCWSSLNDTVKYQKSMKQFWSRTEQKTYIGHKRKMTTSTVDEPTTKKPRFTSTPIPVCVFPQSCLYGKVFSSGKIERKK